MADLKDDEDLSIPRAALNKMIKELVPKVRVANDSRELILNCCTEFIHLVSSEANSICNKHSKKTISPEHVLLGKKGPLAGCWSWGLIQIFRNFFSDYLKMVIRSGHSFTHVTTCDMYKIVAWSNLNHN